MNRSNTQIWGHRGASALFPENTLLAFREAMKAGADGIELDVRLCADGALVVFHDVDGRRLCGDPRAIATMTLQDVAQLSVRGQHVPTLAEVFRACPTAYVNVEMKTHPMGQKMPLVRATIAAIAEAEAWDRVLVSSFDPIGLAMFRALAPAASSGFLLAAGQVFAPHLDWVARGLNTRAIHPDHRLITPERMAKWRTQGVLVNTWTVDAPERLRALAQLGVDTVICNDPGAAVAILR